MDKQELRERVWDGLEESGEARFPFPPHDRIPNFAGADRAADRLTELDAWADAAVVKANPDAPQLPVRRAALRAGKTLYMAVPRLREEECFLRLAPEEVDDIDEATTAVSTVHEMQVVDADVPTTPQDVPMDWLVTPERSIQTDGPAEKPDGIAWDRLDEEKIGEIPILQRLRSES